MGNRFEDIRTFVAVVQGKNFAIAAERLNLAKSAVSRRIRELEDRLGVQLFNRTTRVVKLTNIGIEFYERCVRVLEDMDEAEQIAGQGVAELKGNLRVSAPASFGTLHLMPIVAKFMQRHRGLSVELDLDDRMVDLVNDGFDVALRISGKLDSNLIARRIAPIRHIACASPAYLKQAGIPKVPDDLVRHKGLAYSNVDDQIYWQFCDSKSDRLLAIDVPCKFRANNGEALREAAMAGLGIAALPTFVISKELASGKLVPLLEKYQRPPVYMYTVFPTRRHLAAKVRAFVDFMVEELKSDMPQKIGSDSI